MAHGGGQLGHVNASNAVGPAFCCCYFAVIPLKNAPQLAAEERAASIIVLICFIRSERAREAVVNAQYVTSACVMRGCRTTSTRRAEAGSLSTIFKKPSRSGCLTPSSHTASPIFLPLPLLSSSPSRSEEHTSELQSLM